VGVFAAGAAEDSDFFSCVQDIGCREVLRRWADEGFGYPDGRSAVVVGRAMQEDVAGNDDDGDAGEIDSGAHGDVQDAGHLLRNADHLAIVAALFEEVLGMGLLKVVGADLCAGNVCSDGKDRNAAAMAVEEAVDEVEIAGAAACSADGE